jgi:hypothetical protein
MRAPPLLAAALLALTGLVGRAPAQELSVHHTFPLAGSELVVVVEGFGAGALVQVDLEQALAAPPSVQELLEAITLMELVPDAGGRFSAVVRADARGVVALSFLLDDPGDPARLAALRFSAFGVSDGSPPLEMGLFVQPPTLLVPTADGLARVELLGGKPLLPNLPAERDLMGAAWSADGLSLHALHAGGLLLERSAVELSASPIHTLTLDQTSEQLARSQGGPAFVIARSDGSPFAPPGRLLAVEDGGFGELLIDPLGQAVDGRRWAVTPDGLSAFVAEDDLIVREIDLLSWRVLNPFTVGFNGDRSVADVALDPDRLLVLTRRPGGQPGSLTTLELGSGLIRPWPLGVDPARVVVLDEMNSLVVPADGPAFQLLEQGVPSSLVAAGVPGERLLDATHVGHGVDGGALLLVMGTDGTRRLVTWSPERGLSTLVANVPAGDRLASAGHDLAVLLGAPDGSVHRVVPSRGAIEPIEGLVAAPGGAPHLLP